MMLFRLVICSGFFACLEMHGFKVSRYPPITFEQLITSWIWFIEVAVEGFGNSHSKFNVLLSTYGWAMTASKLGEPIFSGLDVGACIF